MKTLYVALSFALILGILGGCQRQDPGDYAIAITDKGFEPAQTKIPKGQAVTLVFTRKTDQTCATEVVFPTLNQRHALPLNQPVRVELPASVEGEISYACGMDMIKGSIIVR